MDIVGSEVDLALQFALQLGLEEFLRIVDGFGSIHGLVLYGTLHLGQNCLIQIFKLSHVA